MTQTPYPRDMRGYGEVTPDPDWPGGAFVAVQFVINYEEGGENNILHGDAASEAFLSEIVGAQPWPGQRHVNMESIYEYGSRAGFWRLYRMFTTRGLPVTVYAVATALPALARDRRGHAARRLGDRHRTVSSGSTTGTTPRTRSAAISHEAIRIHTRAHGRAAARLVPGRASIHTLRRRRGGRRLPLFRRHLRGRPALLGAGSQRAAADRALHARHQRHALRDRRRASTPASSSSPT